LALGSSKLVSVKMTTPAWPPDCTMAASAVTRATSSGSVDTFIATGVPGTGPALAATCQPTTGMRRSAKGCSQGLSARASPPTTTRPSGRLSSASASTRRRPSGVPPES